MRRKEQPLEKTMHVCVATTRARTYLFCTFLKLVVAALFCVKIRQGSISKRLVTDRTLDALCRRA